MGTPGGAPGAPIPGLAPVTAPQIFTTHILNDPSKDVDQGNYTLLLTPFIIDPNNVGNSLTLEEISSRINGCLMSMDQIALGILVEG